MAYKDAVKQREYQRTWVAAKRALNSRKREQHDESVATIRPPGVLADLQAQLAAAEAIAAPIRVKVHKLESTITTLKHALGLWGMPGVAEFGMGARETDLTPEELIARKKQFDEYSTLLKMYRHQLAPKQAAVNNARHKLKSAQDHAEDHKQRLAKLESEGPIKVKAYREKAQRDAKRLMEGADRLGAEIAVAISKELAEIRRYEGILEDETSL